MTRVNSARDANSKELVLPPSSSLSVFLSSVAFGENSRDSREAEAWPAQLLLKLPKRHYEGVALGPSVTHRNVLLFAIIIKSPLPSYLREHVNMLPENQKPYNKGFPEKVPHS